MYVNVIIKVVAPASTTSHASNISSGAEIPSNIGNNGVAYIREEMVFGLGPNTMLLFPQSKWLLGSPMCLPTGRAHLASAYVTYEQ